jgi:hypothetical protein
MNWYIVGGVISGALSLLLLAYGGIFSSRSESKQSEKQLEQISRDLAELKGKPKSDLSKDALSRVEKDVQKWAAEFATEKQKKRLIWDQRRSEHETSLDHSNALAREYLRFFTAVLRDAIASYSATNGHSIMMELPEVSDAVFSDPDHPYEATITFSGTSSWKIRTMSDIRSGADVAAPWIIMSLLKKSAVNDSPQEKGELLLRFSADMKSFLIRLQQDFLLAVPMESGNSANYPTTDYENRIRDILIRLIEFQLVQD